MPAAVPQSILDALTMTQQAKDDADEAGAASDQADQAVAAAQSVAAQALATSQARDADLADAVGKLTAIIAVYYQPGAPPPLTPSAAPR